jgi:peptide/nickel transport system substrate-binding protein
MATLTTRLVTVGVAACLAFAALAGVPGGGLAAAPTTLTIALGIDADTLDPVGQTTATVSNIVDYIYDPLIWYNDERSGVAPGQPQYTKLVGQLATSWTVSPDGRTYTFKLRQGVKFQDGTPFDAQAVKFNIERMLDPSVRNSSRYYWSALDTGRIEIPDPYTIVLHFKEPSATLPEELATTAAEIVSPAAAKALGNAKLALGPVNAGSGPYIFKEWVHGDHLTLVRNPDYWGRKPYFDQVIFRVVPNAGTRETMLRAGDVQMAFAPPAPDVPAMRRDPSLRVVEGPTDRAIWVGMNNLWGPFKDVRVRQALNYAVNKQAIIHSVLFGLATVLEAPTTPNQFGYTRIQPGGWPFDPARAKRMLTEAGYPNGFSVAFRAPTGRYIQDYQAAQAIAAQLANVGVKATVETADWPSYIGALATPADRTPIQMYMLGQAGPYLDAASQLFGVFYSGLWPPHGYIATFYKDAKVDELLLAGQTTMNPQQRQAIYKQAQELIWHDAPWIFLWAQNFYVVTSSHLEGVSIVPTEKWAAIYATWK